MNEPSENGLSKTLDQFWQSLQDLSTDPDSTAARSVVAERGQDVADTFHYFSKRLQSFRSDENKEIEVTVDEVNNITQRVQEINKQVRKTESHGDLANKLYDERDQLLDKLSDMVNIKVTYSNGDSSTDIGDGVATIELVDQEGKPINQNGKSLTLVDGKENARKELSFEDDNVKLDDEDVYMRNMSGSLKGHVDAATEDYPEMLDNLNKMAKAFGDAFNQQHREGYDRNGGQNKTDFFENIGSADTIKVHPDIADNPDLITANSVDGKNDGENASALADVFDIKLNFGEEDGGKKATVKSFYQSLIAEMGVKTGKANKMKGNSDILRSQVENQRQSVSGVSLDEEMNNMIKFQHAYNAAARSMTTMDEMLDRVINNMGLVGR